jgi:hypothetical protein
MSMPKFAAQDANRILSSLDRAAGAIQQNYEKMGMDFESARDLVHDLDKTADEIEISSFGKESFTARQAEVIHREPDEAYMAAFRNPMEPVQVEADEPYMKAYRDDQSSAVIHGVSTSNRPLTPHSKDTPKPQGM